PEKLDIPLAENTFGWGQLFLAQGRALLDARRHAEALSAAERSLRLADTRGEPPQQAYAMKLLGDIYFALDQSSQAQMYFRRALELAQMCSMRPLQFVCQRALARFVPLGDQPRPMQSHLTDAVTS